MATTVYRHPDEILDVTRYVGPDRKDSMDRTRYQITLIDEEDGKHHSMSLSSEEYETLISTLWARTL